MPLQNRVDPFGDLHRSRSRGAWTGNRGVLHDSDQEIVRRSAARAWIICRLRFRDHHRAVMQPRTWTELFFLDEATAFAAGHRPCFYCRREDAIGFAVAWNLAAGRPGRAYVTEIDPVLRREHTAGPVAAEPADLVDGVMVVDDRDTPHVIEDGTLRPWDFSGYGPSEPLASTGLRLLTPPSTVRAFRAGYVPQIAG